MSVTHSTGKTTSTNNGLSPEILLQEVGPIEVGPIEMGPIEVGPSLSRSSNCSNSVVVTWEYGFL